MYTKFIANGEDMTALFYWEASEDVRRGGGGIPSTLSLHPFVDKAKRIDEKFRQWGVFVIEYYGSDGRAGYQVQFLASQLDCKHQKGKELALIELKVLQRA